MLVKFYCLTLEEEFLSIHTVVFSMSIFLKHHESHCFRWLHLPKPVFHSLYRVLWRLKTIALIIFLVRKFAWFWFSRFLIATWNLSFRCVFPRLAYCQCKHLSTWHNSWDWVYHPQDGYLCQQNFGFYEELIYLLLANLRNF